MSTNQDLIRGQHDESFIGDVVGQLGGPLAVVVILGDRPDVLPLLLQPLNAKVVKIQFFIEPVLQKLPDLAVDFLLVRILVGVGHVFVRFVLLVDVPSVAVKLRHHRFDRFEAFVLECKQKI